MVVIENTRISELIKENKESIEAIALQLSTLAASERFTREAFSFLR